MANEPSPDQVEAPVQGEPELKCQAILDNRMQCNNKAYVTIANIPYCRLHLNWMVGKKELNPDFYVKAIDEVDQEDVDRVVADGKNPDKEN